MCQDLSVRFRDKARPSPRTAESATKLAVTDERRGAPRTATEEPPTGASPTSVTDGASNKSTSTPVSSARSFALAVATNIEPNCPAGRVGE